MAGPTTTDQDPVPVLIVGLPCFNEEAALPGLLHRIQTVRNSLHPFYETLVLVLDDGSSDNTAECALGWRGELPVELLRHSENRGLGGAVQSIIGHSLAKDCTTSECILAMLDADGTHPPELLPSMARKLEAERLDVVIASRFAPGGAERGLPLLRKIYTRLAGLAMRMLAPVPNVRDYSCGYRVYRMEALKRTSLRFGDQLVTERGFVCMVELLIKLARSGAKCGEVGLDLHYELKQGPSKMDVAATIRRYAWFALRARFDPKLR